MEHKNTGRHAVDSVAKESQAVTMLTNAFVTMTIAVCVPYLLLPECGSAGTKKCDRVIMMQGGLTEPSRSRERDRMIQKENQEKGKGKRFPGYPPLREIKVNFRKCNHRLLLDLGNFDIILAIHVITVMIISVLVNAYATDLIDKAGTGQRRIRCSICILNTPK